MIALFFPRYSFTLSSQSSQNFTVLAKSYNPFELDATVACWTARNSPLLALNISQESTDSARVVHSLDSPAILPVKSDLQVRF